MMKSSALLVMICMLSFEFSHAQGTIKGKIQEKEQPIGFVNVILKNSTDTTKIVMGTLSEVNGDFVLENVPKGKYLLQLKFIGYQTRNIENLEVQGGLIELGNLEFKTDTKLMSEIVVEAKKELIEKTAESTVINADASLTQAGGTASDLLKNAPGVQVDADGNITLRGKSPLVLINGRNSGLAGSDRSAQLDRIPASAVETIEIINNPSAKYDADAEGGVINIKLKKETKQGTNFIFGIGGGAGAKGRANLSTRLNHNVGKYNFSLSYDNRYADRTRSLNGDRTNYEIANNFYLIQRRSDNRSEQTHNIRMGIDFIPNQKNNFGLELIYGYDGQNNNESLNNTFKTINQDFTSKNNRFSSEIINGQVFEGAFNHQRSFEKKDQKLITKISTSVNKDIENADINTKGLDQNSNVISIPYLQNTRSDQNTLVANGQIDYIHPISNNSFLEVGYKGIIRRLYADFKSNNFINDAFQINPLASNLFQYGEQIHAAYAQFKSTVGDSELAHWTYSLGLRVENVWTEGTSDANNISFRKEYFNFFPSVNFAYYFSPSNFLKLTYSRRINRPGLGQLNPFTDITDSLNVRSGNPLLNPELVHSVEAGYSTEWGKLNFSGTLFYRYATNTIRPYTVLGSDNIARTKPLNFGNAITYGFEVIATADVSKWFDFNASYSLFQQSFDGSNINSTLSNNAISWNAKLIGNFNFWKGFKIQTLLNYNSPVATPQGTRREVYNIDMSIQQKIFKDKGRIALTITDVFNVLQTTNITNGDNFQFTRTSKIDTRAFIITFGYTFRTEFKEDVIRNKFSND